LYFYCFHCKHNRKLLSNVHFLCVLKNRLVEMYTSGIRKLRKLKSFEDAFFPWTWGNRIWFSDSLSFFSYSDFFAWIGGSGSGGGGGWTTPPPLTWRPPLESGEKVLQGAREACLPIRLLWVTNSIINFNTKNYHELKPKYFSALIVLIFFAKLFLKLILSYFVEIIITFALSLCPKQHIFTFWLWQ